MLLKYTDRCTIIPPVCHFAPRDFTIFNWAANIGTAPSDAVYRALSWRHKKAKSFTIYDFTYTNYSGFPVSEITFWYSCKVRYYSTAKEGMFKVPDKFESNLDDKFDLLACLGIDIPVTEDN